MTVCVGDRHDAVRRSAHSADPRLYVGGLPERNHLLRDSGLEWNCKKGSKRIYVNIIFNLALKIFVYPFFYCLAGSFYHCRFGSPLRLRFSSPWVLGSGFCWRYQATTSWTTTVTSKRVSWQISPCHLYIYKVFRLLWTSQFSSCKCVRRIRFWWRNF